MHLWRDVKRTFYIFNPPTPFSHEWRFQMRTRKSCPKQAKALSQPDFSCGSRPLQGAGAGGEAVVHVRDEDGDDRDDGDFAFDATVQR